MVWNILKVNNNDTRTRQWRHSGVFIVNFEHISYLVLVFLLLTLSKLMPPEIVLLTLQMYLAAEENSLNVNLKAKQGKCQ